MKSIPLSLMPTKHSNDDLRRRYWTIASALFLDHVFLPLSEYLRLLDAILGPQKERLGPLHVTL